MSGDISRYVTDPHGDVYAIVGLPEEILAVVFAYVSRSPKSFRENLLEVTAERAEAFHEKWVLQYGHASVAEHAAVHLGIERLSRFASAILEDSRLISVTEYSQRYQEPRAEDVHMPREIRGSDAERTARQCFASLYSLYTGLLEGLSAHLAREMPRKPEETETAWARRLRRRAFEDARYVLPLATTTSLGLTTNARELEYVISKCLSHRVEEVRALGEAMREASRRVAPTLVKYAAPLPYRERVEARRREILREFEAGPAADLDVAQAERPVADVETAGARAGAWSAPVELVDWTGRQGAAGDAAPGDAERAALLAVLGSFLEPAARDPLAVRRGLDAAPTASLRGNFAGLIAEPARHESLPRELESVVYTFHVTLSEAAWHQFLRHRMMSTYPGEPRIDLGVRIPPLIEAAGLSSRVTAGHDVASAAHAAMAGQAPLAAPYLVTNAHLRRVRLVMNLRQLGHLTRLRTGPHAQWDIREVSAALLESARRVHPSLIAAISAPCDPAPPAL